MSLNEFKERTFIVFILVQHENLYFCFVNIVCTNVFKPFVQDTRALVVQEVFQVEKSYVESLQFLVVVSSHNLNMDKTGHLKVLLFSKAFIVVSRTMFIRSISVYECPIKSVTLT